MTADLAELDPSITVFGHIRKGWTTEGEGVLPLADPPRPEKGAFTVSVVVGTGDAPVVVAQTGPEPRPFPHLAALDTRQLAESIQGMLS